MKVAISLPAASASSNLIGAPVSEPPRMLAKLGMGLTIGSSPAASASTSVRPNPSYCDALTKKELEAITRLMSSSLGSHEP